MSAIDRLFDNTARIGNDSCDLTNKNKQNIEASNYILENYNVYNPVSSAINLATNQPNIFLQGSPNGGINGDNIDDNSVLKFSKSTNLRERSVYQERLFSTVPYLGKGPSNAPLESQLVMGDVTENKKSLDPNSEVSHINYNYTPLIPSIEATVANPANLVEGVAASGWIRGGVPSRILHREEDVN
jgi:hypothetical protein